MNQSNSHLCSVSSERLSYIDVIKGIGILLVVLQHCLGGDAWKFSARTTKNYSLISYAAILFRFWFSL